MALRVARFIGIVAVAISLAPWRRSSRQVVFWVVTYPVNVATAKWTVLPRPWTLLRDRWEYSHAAGSLLMLGALASSVASALWED